MNKRIEYAKFTDLIKSAKTKEKTELEGVYNYKLRNVYAPVLDRKFINSFNPEKTCISVCGNKEFEFNEDELIQKVIEQVKKLKDYHNSSEHGKKEHIGEYNLFSEISVDGFMLESYSFGIDSEKEYYLILWFTPTYLFNGVHKHIFWYEKKHTGGWY